MFGDLLEKLARTFAAYAIPFMIIGGQAVLLYGEPRLTRHTVLNHSIPSGMSWGRGRDNV